MLLFQHGLCTGEWPLWLFTTYMPIIPTYMPIIPIYMPIIQVFYTPLYAVNLGGRLTLTVLIKLKRS